MHQPEFHDDHLVERLSAEPFDTALDRISAAIEVAGMQILARIDHAANARAVGLDMPRTVVLVYGNPRVGTPAMLKAPTAALDLPLRVLVREDADGRVCIAFRPILPTLTRSGVPEELAARLAAGQVLVLEAIQRGNAGSR